MIAIQKVLVFYYCIFFLIIFNNKDANTKKKKKRKYKTKQEKRLIAQFKNEYKQIEDRVKMPNEINCEFKKLNQITDFNEMIDYQIQYFYDYFHKYTKDDQETEDRKQFISSAPAIINGVLKTLNILD